MSEYRLRLTLTVDPITRPVPPDPNLPGGLGNAFTHLRWAEAHGAKGTYVEVETTGQVCEVDASMRQTYDPNNTRHDEVTLSKSFVVPITRSGRDLVLLAVGGGNQLFDHWEGSYETRNQGSRCVLPEPREPDPEVLAEAPDFVAEYEITAIFKTDPHWEPKGEKLRPDSSTMHSRLSRPSPRFEREP